ncbi:hypothetical protein PIB30_072020, partial [Stylosanthes scabra]|nr:hypothetical protein [Stylosanthes scabra]
MGLIPQPHHCGTFPDLDRLGLLAKLPCERLLQLLLLPNITPAKLRMKSLFSSLGLYGIRGANLSVLPNWPPQITTTCFVICQRGRK